MGDKSSIEWTDSTWNPVVGCTRVSEGCRNCYAYELHDRRHRAYTAGKKLPEQYAKPFKEVQLFPDRLAQPFHWKRPRRIFVNSLSDLFHDDVPDDFIWSVFEIMAQSPQHTFQVLTKRPQRMAALLAGRYWRDLGTPDRPFFAKIIKGEHRAGDVPFLPNVWLGVSVENQRAADERIPLLLQTPAAVRFLSMEPLLGPVDLKGWIYPGWDGDIRKAIPAPRVYWVIVGGESGPNARPMHPDWVRSIRDQCQAAGVPFFFKQWGEWAQVHELRCNEPGIKGKPWFNFNPDTSVCRIGRKAAGRLLDGRTWDEMPEVVR
ncbi:DUF5131 family protein [Cohnella massiliensis]|uniref:DUF5131 family protein n=1 Tax=Cohnella massiliensis TaxID=1816691 RepID=UPI0009B96851|nr:phage Gp37/Gp68 family protein [Cohnella massiliensis]